MRRGLEARFADLLAGRPLFVFLCDEAVRCDVFALLFFFTPLERREDDSLPWPLERESKSPPITVPCVLGSVTPGKNVARVPLAAAADFAAVDLVNPFFFRALL